MLRRIIVLTIVGLPLLGANLRVQGQTPLIPIARWDAVPYQRLNAGSIMNVGVVAFSKAGIAGVRFTVSGPGYTHQEDVTDMSLNPQSGAHEYWISIDCDDFSNDGYASVDAVVYGADGGERDKTTGCGDPPDPNCQGMLGLDTLPFVVNRLGTLP